MKISACFEPLEMPVFLDTVTAAEEAGYSRIWISDSQMIWQDVYVFMTRALAATKRIQVGTFVTNPLTRHYTVTASAHATLADIHPGRVILGVGRGESSVRTLGLKPISTRAYAEVIPKIRDLMAGLPISENGNELRITWADEVLPLAMGASGPRNLQLAGALADVVILQVGTLPEAVEWAIASVRSGAEQAGRDPSAIDIVVTCAMWVSSDPAEIHAKCAYAPIVAANHLRRVLTNSPDHGMPPQLMRVLVPSAEYDYYEHCVPEAAHYADVTDQMIRDFSIVGTPSECLERIGELAALGVEEIAAFPLNGELDQIELVRDEIMGALIGTTQ